MPTLDSRSLLPAELLEQVLTCPDGPFVDLPPLAPTPEPGPSDSPTTETTDAAPIDTGPAEPASAAAAAPPAPEPAPMPEPAPAPPELLAAEAAPADSSTHQVGNRLLADAETAAELQRIAAMSPEAAEAIPSLDEDETPTTPQAVTPPAPGSPAGAEAELVSALAEIAATPAKPEPAAADPAAQPRKHRFKMGQKADAAAGAAAADAAAAGPQLSGVWKHIYRAADNTLEALSRPLKVMGDGARGLIGTLALTTIVVSLTASSIVPLITPYEDAAGFVRRKREEMDRPPPEVAAPADAHGEKAGADKHGKGDKTAHAAKDKKKQPAGHGKDAGQAKKDSGHH